MEWGEVVVVLDLLVDAATYDACLAALATLGYVAETDWLPVRLELVAAGRGWVDVHPVVFDAGTGVQGRPPGPVFTYPPEVFTTAVLEGRVVPCFTAPAQRAFHAGYDPRPHDRHDLAVLDGLAVP